MKTIWRGRREQGDGRGCHTPLLGAEVRLDMELTMRAGGLKGEGNGILIYCGQPTPADWTEVGATIVKPETTPAEVGVRGWESVDRVALTAFCADSRAEVDSLTAVAGVVAFTTKKGAPCSAAGCPGASPPAESSTSTRVATSLCGSDEILLCPFCRFTRPPPSQLGPFRFCPRRAVRGPACPGIGTCRQRGTTSGLAWCRACAG